MLTSFFCPLVVHNPSSLCAIPRASLPFNSSNKEESILSELPYYASNHDRSLGDGYVSSCCLLPPHQPHGLTNPARPNRLRADICLQELNNKTHFWPLDRGDAHGARYAQSASVRGHADGWRYFPKQVPI